jgi:membrane complex biogenesis BtpA family protein
MPSWMSSVFGVEKPIVAMCHLLPLPGDPGYNPSGGIEAIVAMARADLLALQGGGVDAILFSNERSMPWMTRTEPITSIVMARVIAELLPDLRLPYGVDVIWDPVASIDLAVATGAQFVREVFTGAYASDFGLWSPNCGEIIRHQHAVHGENVRLMFNITPEAASYLGERLLIDIAKSTVFNARPDGLCISGMIAGTEVSLDQLRTVKEVVPETPIWSNTGVSIGNVREQLAASDGAIIGTAFKEQGYIWNRVDPERVRVLMDEVRQVRFAPAVAV